MKDPALALDLVTAGMIREVAVADGRVTVAIELTTPACPSREAITAAAQAALRKLPGVTDLQLDVTASVRGRAAHPQNARLPGVKNILARVTGGPGSCSSTSRTGSGGTTARPARSPIRWT